MTTLEQIIQKLKTTREGKGLTVEQICDKTKIPLHQLEGLEQGRFDDLPEPIYVSGFIKLYANQLGLNGQLLANEYREWADTENPRNQLNGNRKRIKSAPDVPIIVSDDYFQKNKIEASPPTFKTIYFNIIMIMLVLGLVSYLGMTQFNNYSNQLENTGVVTPQSTTTRGTTTTAPETQTNNAATKEPGSIPSSSHNQLILSASKHVWIEVKSAATGDNLYIGYLEPGSNKIFDTPEQGLRIRATDGADVSVNYQGQTSTLGIAGQETEKVFTPQAVAGQPSTNAGSSTASPASISSPSTPESRTVNSSTSSTPAVNPATKSTAPTTASATSTTHKRHTAGTALHNSSYSNSTSDGQPYKYGEGRLDTD